MINPKFQVILTPSMYKTYEGIKKLLSPNGSEISTETIVAFALSTYLGDLEWLANEVKTAAPKKTASFALVTDGTVYRYNGPGPLHSVEVAECTRKARQAIAADPADGMPPAGLPWLPGQTYCGLEAI